MTLYESLRSALSTPSARLYAAVALLVQDRLRRDGAPTPDAIQALHGAFCDELRGALDDAPSFEAAAPRLGVPARTLVHWTRTWMPDYLAPRDRAILAAPTSAADHNH